MSGRKRRSQPTIPFRIGPGGKEASVILDHATVRKLEREAGQRGRSRQATLEAILDEQLSAVPIATGALGWRLRELGHRRHHANRSVTVRHLLRAHFQPERAHPEKLTQERRRPRHPET